MGRIIEKRRSFRASQQQSENMSMKYWEKQLKKHKVTHEGFHILFNQKFKNLD